MDKNLALLYLLYTYVGIVSAFIIGLIYNRMRSLSVRDKMDAIFGQVLKFFLVFCAVDATWGIVGSKLLFESRLVYSVFTYGFHFMSALAAFMCSYYCMQYIDIKGMHRLVVNTIRYSLLTAQMGLLFSNLVTHAAFTIDENAIYHSTPLRHVTFYMQFCHYIPLMLYAAAHLFNRSRDVEARRRHYLYVAVVFFTAIPLVFGWLQMVYPDMPFYSLGFAVVSVAIYAFNVTAQKEEVMAAYYEALEREKSRHRIEEALKRAEEANSAKTVFLSNMSHDIRTPINGIMGMLAICKQEEMSAKAHDCLGKIEGASRHLLSLINDILDMSRIESGKTKIAHEPINIMTVVDNCYSIISGQLLCRRLDFKVSYTEVKHASVFGDDLHLRQVFINILGNAIKFTPDGKSIAFDIREVRTDADTVEIEFKIADTGIGMSPEFQKHLFEAFSQEEGGNRTNYKGTGLGMAITKNLVEMMGGSIAVESVQGKGSTFTVRLPFDINHAPVSAAKKESATPEIKGVRILLVEDNELNMEIAHTLLEEDGAVITEAANGKEAVAVFSDSKPGDFDIILMDVMMPEMNGLEATRAIRALKRPDAKSIPIIAMTANAFDEDKRATLEAGMNAHIAKPIHFPTLKAVIGECR